jgi:hypothetical protein
VPPSLPGPRGCLYHPGRKRYGQSRRFDRAPRTAGIGASETFRNVELKGDAPPNWGREQWPLNTLKPTFTWGSDRGSGGLVRVECACGQRHIADTEEHDPLTSLAPDLIMPHVMGTISTYNDFA